MQSLLIERITGKLRPRDFAVTLTESLYGTLRPVEPNMFPENCHHNAAVNSLSLETSDFRYLLSGCADSSIKLWDLHADRAQARDSCGNDEDIEADLELEPPPESKDPSMHLQPVVTIPRRSAHAFGVSAVQWWPRDTGLFLSASFDHTVKVWDTNEVEVVHEFDMVHRVYAIDVSAHVENDFSSQALIAVASDQPFIRLLDLRSASSAHTLPGHRGKTLAVKWHPQNSYLLASGGHDGEAKIWDIRMSRSCVARLDMQKTSVRSAAEDTLNLGASSVKAHSGPVNALVWDELGHVLYTAGNDDKIRVWDMAASIAPPVNRLVNFGPLTRNKYLQTLPLVLSPRNETEVQHLLFASDNGDVLVFRAIDGKLVSRLQRSGTQATARTASIVYGGPNSATYYCGTMDGEIVPWRPERPVQECVFVGKESEIFEDFANNTCDSRETNADAFGADIGADLGMDAAGRAAAKVAARDGLYDDPFFKHNLK